MDIIRAQTCITDSFNNPIWPGFTVGDTNVFIRQNTTLTSNSANINKHSFGLKFNLSQRKDVEISSQFLVGINLSSANFIDFGLIDSNNKNTFIRLGNSLDQLQFYIHDSLMFKGPEQEFNLTNFSAKFQIKYTNNQFIIEQKLDHQKSKKQYIIPLNYPTKMWKAGFLKITQFGSSAIGKHAFKYLYLGNVRIDTISPKTLSVNQLNNHKIELKFNEQIKFFNETNISLNPLKIEKIELTSDSSSVILTVVNPSRNSIDSLKIKIFNLTDMSGNILKSQNFLLKYQFVDTPKFGEIILTEVMSKPIPGLGILPEKKYIEIYNNSNKTFNLNTLLLSDQVSKINLPNFIFLPKTLLLLVSASDTAYFQNLPFLGVNSFPSFNQDEDHVTLKTIENRIIFHFQYCQNLMHWNYRNGGYSLEKINLNKGSSEIQNWQNNSQFGGTPGKINLLKPSDNLDVIDIVESYFNEDSIFVRLNQTIDPNLQYFIRMGNFEVQLNHLTSTILKGKISKAMAQFHKLGLTTFGNQDSILMAFDSPLYSYKVSPNGHNLNFNELLFHNFTGAHDYLEFVNNDTLAIFWNQFLLNTYDTDGISIKQQLPLKNNERWLIYPHEIIAFTNDKTRLIDQFPSSDLSKIIDYSGFPNFNSEMGHLECLHLKQFVESSDKMSYSKNMHVPFYQETTGISIEKYNTQLNSNSSQSWTSATMQNQFGTPGIQNSVFFDKGQSVQHQFSLRNNKIYIGNNISDPLIVDYQFNLPGYIMNASIYNKDGYLIEHCIQNQRVGISGSLSIQPVFRGNFLSTENYVIKLEGFLPNADICRQLFRFTVFNPNTH